MSSARSNAVRRPREVVVELAAGLVERPRRAEDAASGQQRERLELLLGLGVERDAGEPAVGDGGEQRAELAVDHVVGRIEQLGTRAAASRKRRSRSVGTVM